MKDTSPEALAGKLVLDWRAHISDIAAMPNCQVLICDAIASLIRRERAACVRIARTYSNADISDARCIARDILARNNPPKRKA